MNTILHSAFRGNPWRRRMASFLVVVLPVLGYAASSDTLRELAPNSGVELSRDGTRPDHWEPSNPGCRWADDSVHSGGRSLKISSTGGATVSWTSAPISVAEPGTQFILSVWARLEEVTGQNGAFFALYHLDEEHVRIGQSATTGIGGAQGEVASKPWTRYAAVSQLGPEVKAVQINVRLYGAAGTVWFDDISLRTFEHVELLAPRPLRQGLALTTGEVVLCPGEGEALNEAALELHGRLRKRGVAAVLVDHETYDSQHDPRDIVALGNMVTNRVCESLYLNYYTYEDLAFPGRDGFVVRPLIDPWGTGANVLVVGVSGAGGLTSAVAAVVDALGSSEGALCVPLTVKRGPPIPSNTVLRPAGRREMGPAGRYLKSGNVAEAQAYRERILATWFAPDETLFSSDTSLHLYYVTRTLSWELMEASGVFSDDERLRVTNQLLKIMRSSQGYGYSGMNPGLRSRENHATRAARAFYFGWRHFAKYYTGHLGVETTLWRARLRDFWRAPLSSSRSYEDSLSQHAFGGSLDNTLDIAFMEPSWSEQFREQYARPLGDRCISVCNNRGELVLLGDTAPGGYPLSAFAKLAYWLRDGRFQYMMDKRGTRGASTDEPLRSFAIGVSPRTPEDHLGLTVVPGDRLYFRTGLRNAGSVPLERSFDKLTIRSGFAETDEYLMLDGVAGGSHSYDDANSIGEYSANGRRWLCEIDIFNGPTMSFHNAVTVARKGIGNPVVPQAAELMDSFERTSAVYSATRLPDYNGADWTRHILWLQGAFTFVLDELAAGEADDYGFVLGWRGLGDVTCAPGRWTLSQDGAASSSGLSGSDLVAAVTSSSGKHLRCLDGYEALFYRADAVEDFVEVSLPTTENGPHELTVAALDFDKRAIVRVDIDGHPIGSPIDLWVSGQPRMSRHSFGPIDLVAGAHRIRFTAVGTQPKSGGYTMAFTGVALQPAGRAEPALTPTANRFHLVFPAGVSATFDEDRENLGKDLPMDPHYDQVLRICEQSINRVMEGGDTAAFQNAFYTSTATAPREWSLRRLSEHGSLLRSADSTVFVMASSTDTVIRIGGLVLAGRVACLGLGDPVLHHARLEVDGAPFDAGNEEHVAEIHDALTAAWERSAPSGLALQPQWAEAKRVVSTAQMPLPSSPLSLAMVPGDGGDRLVTGTRSGSVLVWSVDGERVGEFTAQGAVHALCMTDLEPDGVPEVLVGSDDEYLYALSGDGDLLWKRQIPFMLEKQIWMWWTLGSAKVRKIHTDDLTGDGVPEILVGAGNMHLHCLDNSGKERWNFRMDHGICTTIVTANLLADGKRHVLAGNGLTSSNGYCRIFDASGREQRRLFNGSWCTSLPAVAVGDLDGDGIATVFCGTNRGNLRAYDVQQSKGEQLWIHNTTRPIRSLLTFARTAVSSGLVVAASDSGYVCAFDQGGTPLWATPLSSAVVEIVKVTSPDGVLIAAGCRDGRCFWLDLRGWILAVAACPGKIVDITPLSVSEGGIQGIAAATQNPDALVVLPGVSEGR
ncbi:MAG: hypothetical protein HN742_38330 [Lentisphaerae bacterium]|jgi:outer membrane protein assembly factor BamB|nr:hypothetical protein [Lentisphaerota bacterium]MBT4817738.1 hypothetical protein [Lentisphaerota bacterium]MBT5609304.1 hypothetical protein [Lentisphaerota bacterium]MBT7059402.1 hypothetical protein [Lentisphaerota bacterium]MBT7847786.1 hypothetical protein [Lentisphaerota bacterium]